jgi:ribosomal protein S27E
MKSFIEARGEHKPSLMLQAATPEGESGAVKKPRVLPHIYKCADCGLERKVADHAHAPKVCSYCGSVNVGFDRTEVNDK